MGQANFLWASTIIKILRKKSREKNDEYEECVGCFMEYVNTSRIIVLK